MPQLGKALAMIDRPPGIRHREECPDPSRFRVDDLGTGRRIAVCHACEAAAVVPSLATGFARVGYFAEHDITYTPNRRKKPMFNRTAAPDPTPAPTRQQSAEYLPLTLVAAELGELGLDDPDDLARHVGASRITLAAGLVRCISTTTVSELVDQLDHVRARKAAAAERAAEQARILEEKQFTAAVAERVHREKVQRVIDATGFPYVVASEVVTGERDETGQRRAEAERLEDLFAGRSTYTPIVQTTRE